MVSVVKLDLLFREIWFPRDGWSSKGACLELVPTSSQDLHPDLPPVILIFLHKLNNIVMNKQQVSGFSSLFNSKEFGRYTVII